MSSMGTVAEYKDVLSSVFLTKEKNAAGIIALRFYIRGKPWVVAMDSDLLFTVDDSLEEPFYLEFAAPDKSKKIMWGARGRPASSERVTPSMAAERPRTPFP